MFCLSCFSLIKRRTPRSTPTDTLLPYTTLCRSTPRRKRIIRVRSVEHQQAEANLARANGELANLVELAKRLETLRVDLAMAKGAVAGRALNTIGELAMRLDIAQIGRAHV